MMEKSYQRHLNRKSTISELCSVNAEVFSSFSSRSVLNNLTTNTTCRLSNPNCPRILPGLALPLKLLLISFCIGIVDAVQSLESPANFYTSRAELKCINYNYRQFTIADRICDDCYNLYREPELYVLCRQDCFTSSYYKGCLDELLVSDDEREQLKEHIRHLNGVDILNEILKENSENAKIDVVKETDEFQISTVP